MARNRPPFERTVLVEHVLSGLPHELAFGLCLSGSIQSFQANRVALEFHFVEPGEGVEWPDVENRVAIQSQMLRLTPIDNGAEVRNLISEQKDELELLQGPQWAQVCDLVRAEVEFFQLNQSGQGRQVRDFIVVQIQATDPSQLCQGRDVGQPHPFEGKMGDPFEILRCQFPLRFSNALADRGFNPKRGFLDRTNDVPCTRLLFPIRRKP